MDEFVLNRETLLVYLADYIGGHPSLVKQFEDIYKTDVERFYLRALK